MEEYLRNIGLHFVSTCLWPSLAQMELWCSRGIVGAIVSQARIRSRQLSGNKLVPEPRIQQDEGWLSGYLQLYPSP